MHGTAERLPPVGAILRTIRLWGLGREKGKQSLPERPIYRCGSGRQMHVSSGQKVNAPPVRQHHCAVLCCAVLICVIYTIRSDMPCYSMRRYATREGLCEAIYVILCLSVLRCATAVLQQLCYAAQHCATTAVLHCAIYTAVLRCSALCFPTILVLRCAVLCYAVRHNKRSEKHVALCIVLHAFGGRQRR